MLSLLSQYALFLAKTLTLLVALVLTFATLLALTAKAKKHHGTITLEPIHDKIRHLRQHLQQQTLTKREWKKWHKAQKAQKPMLAFPRLFVIRFQGDVRATQITSLRECISAIIEIATPQDEVLIILESAGGLVHSYGLAASQLQRLRQRALNLTVAIDKLAASGGYLMACVANQIIAAPFAIVGSIGVVAQLPNFYRFLNKKHIDFELHTAGEYKRTLTLFGKNNAKAKKKFQQELDQTHTLFKEYIHLHRPQIDIEQIATGEHWHALQALQLNLVDKLQTSDDFILEKIKTNHVFEINFQHKQRLSERLLQGGSMILEKLFLAR